MEFDIQPEKPVGECIYCVHYDRERRLCTNKNSIRIEVSPFDGCGHFTGNPEYERRNLFGVFVKSTLHSAGFSETHKAASALNIEKEILEEIFEGKRGLSIKHLESISEKTGVPKETWEIVQGKFPKICPIEHAVMSACQVCGKYEHGLYEVFGKNICYPCYGEIEGTEITRNNSKISKEINDKFGEKFFNELYRFRGEVEIANYLPYEIIDQPIGKLQPEEGYEGFDRIYVDQHSGGHPAGDDYYGTICVPLPDGRYFKFHFSS